MKILITGSRGQLGTELLNQLQFFKSKENLEIISPTKNELNLSNLKL